jgi:hypothetical protein
MSDLREAIDTLPRYVVVVQPAQGWTKEHGRESQPVIHEAVLLADVRGAVGDGDKHVPRLRAEMEGLEP